MFDWLFEGRTSVYILLAIGAVVLFYFGWQLRRRALFVAGGIAAALILVYFLLDRIVETDREQVRRKLLAMADGVKARDADRILAHVSEKFSSWGKNRATLRDYIVRHFQDGSIDELLIGDIEFPAGATPTAEGTVRVTFYAKPKSTRLGTTPSFPGEATFVRDLDGEWRVTGFNIFEPFVNSNAPLEKLP